MKSCSSDLKKKMVAQGLTLAPRWRDFPVPAEFLGVQALGPSALRNFQSTVVSLTNKQLTKALSFCKTFVPKVKKALKVMGQNDQHPQRSQSSLAILFSSTVLSRMTASTSEIHPPHGLNSLIIPRYSQSNIVEYFVSIQVLLPNSCHLIKTRL